MTQVEKSIVELIADDIQNIKEKYTGDELTKKIEEYNIENPRGGSMEEFCLAEWMPYFNKTKRNELNDLYKMR